MKKIMKKLTYSFLLVSITLTFQISCTEDEPEPPLKGDATDILTFSVPGEVAASQIDATAHTVNSGVPYGTDRTNLAPIWTLSTGATSNPTSAIAGDYSSAVTITVTAEDLVTTQDWTANVLAANPNNTDILTFTVPEQTSAAAIDATNHTVDVEVSNGTNLASLTPTWTVSAGAASAPASGSTGDYSSTATITVTAADAATTQDWTVNVTEATTGGGTGTPSSATDILTFTTSEQVRDSYIDADLDVVVHQVPTSVDQTNLIATWTLSPGATSVPASGTILNYSTTVPVTVTAEDGTTATVWLIQVVTTEDDYCNEALCANDETRKAACIAFLIDCIANEPNENEDECIIEAVFFNCKEIGGN
jgi:hypothetical protein